MGEVLEKLSFWLKLTHARASAPFVLRLQAEFGFIVK
jgi:hypothetical protein